MKRWIVAAWAGSLLTPLIWSPTAQAEGFGDLQLEVPSSNLELEEVDLAPQGNWGVYGFVQVEGAAATERLDDKDSLAKLRTTLNLSLDGRIAEDWRLYVNGSSFYDHAYRLNGREQYNEATLEAYEEETELRDAYLSGTLGNGFSLKAGRQILAWGESEANQINDMANPRDNREPGMVELEDARLPVAASLLTWTGGGWRADMAAIHEYRSHKTAPLGSEFDPLAAIQARGIAIAPETKPENDGEWAVRLMRSFNGADLGVYWSDTHSDQFHLEFDGIERTGETPQLRLRPEYSRVQSLGISGNLVWGSLLLKGEMARKAGVAYQRKDLEAQAKALLAAGGTPTGQSAELEAHRTTEQMQHMLGLEYMGWSDLTVTLETTYSRVPENEDEDLLRAESFFTFSSATYTAFNDRLNSRLAWIHYGNEDGDIYRWITDYDWVDGLNLYAGLVVYQAPTESALLAPYQENDRLILGGRFSF